MNKSTLMLFGLLVGITAGVIQATSELRSPLGRFGDIWFDYRYMLDPVNNDGWHVDVQKVAYERCSGRSFGFGPKCAKKCDESKVTTNTIPLSALLFNKADFKGQEIFFGGNLNGRASNAPGLVFANLSPRVSYNEQGVNMGVHAYRELADKPHVRIGGRIGLPVKVIKMEEDRSGGIERLDSSLQSDCVVSCRNETTAVNIENSSEVCAYRLDYLASLQLPNGVPMVQFGDGTMTNPTKIADVIVDDSIFTTFNSTTGFTPTCDPLTINSEGPNAPLYLMRQSMGSMPFNPIVNLDTQNPEEDSFILQNACAYPLPANGSGGVDNDRFRFINSNNYAANLANNIAEQAKWFAIPVPGPGVKRLNPISEEIFNIIKFVVEKQGGGAISSESATNFLAGKGVDLTPSRRVVGTGDLEMQFYAGRYWDRSYFNGFIGFRLPTGKEHDNPKDVYFQPTGHNGHFEVMFGIDGGVRANSWFAFNGDVAYHYVAEHTERRAAPFCGAIIRNIGPGLDMNVRWGWVQANAIFTFSHPQDSDLGCSFAYEFYAKQKDNITLCSKTATDFLGKDFSLDKRLLEKNTNSQTHKIRGTGFYKIGYAEFMFGAYYIVAGKHAMRESEWHVGMNVSF